MKTYLLRFQTTALHSGRGQPGNELEFCVEADGHIEYVAVGEVVSTDPNVIEFCLRIVGRLTFERELWDAIKFWTEEDECRMAKRHAERKMEEGA